MFAQTVAAISQIWVLGIPARLAAVWFGPNEVSTATSLGVFGNQVRLLGRLSVWPRVHHAVPMSSPFYACAFHETLFTVQPSTTFNSCTQAIDSYMQYYCIWCFISCSNLLPVYAQVGIAVGFLTPPIIVPNSESLDTIGTNLRNMFFGTAAVTTAIFLLILICESGYTSPLIYLCR